MCVRLCNYFTFCTNHVIFGNMLGSFNDKINVIGSTDCCISCVLECLDGNIVPAYPTYFGVGRVAGIGTGYGLDGPGIESQWGARFSSPVQTGPGAHPASCAMSTRSFLGVKNGRGVTLTPHPLLVPYSWKVRAIPLLPLRAVRPVQGLSACTRSALYFTLP